MKNLIVPHNPNWITEFVELTRIFYSVLNDFEVDIQHVGSTAIPELFAKPILDIDIIINDQDQLEDISAQLERLGYNSIGDLGIPGRFAFRQSSNLTPSTVSNRIWQEHHLYVCYSDCLAVKNHILFRDTLLSNVELVKEYSYLKKNLVNENEMTRENYTRRKTEFIISVLKSKGFDEEELIEIKNANK